MDHNAYGVIVISICSDTL